MSSAQKGNRFASLRALREQRQEEPDNAAVIEQDQSVNKEEETDENLRWEESVPAQTVESEQPKTTQQNQAQTKPARKRGRPPGRRSDPDYTQISAYIPLDLLLAVQDELAAERRERRERTARPVSDLVEALLAEWLEKRKSSKSRN
ncbi:MAG: hypothetical protein ACTS2F_25295 [Thainema sp.]